MSSNPLGDAIRAARKEVGLSQEAAARELNVSFVTWNRWECGHNMPNVPALAEIASLLNTTVSALTEHVKA